MKKPVNIYIDYVAEDSNDEFAIKLRKHLQGVKFELNITLFSDLEFENVAEEWEVETIKAIEKADIVIPILSNSYLRFISEEIEFKFEEIIDSSDRYLFPVYYESSNWSSYNWIVKSKLTPSGSIALSDYPSKESEKIIVDFIDLIRNILISYYSTDKYKETADIISPLLSQKSIFISHDHEDADFAELLKLRLEKNSIIGWIDSERLKIGQDWREEIDESISNSLAVIAIMTPDARKSEYVTYEWAFAWGKGIKVFPIMLKQTQLHPRLESLQYIDFTNRSARPWDKLIESIRELL